QEIYDDIQWGYEGYTHAERIDLANAALDAVTGVSDTPDTIPTPWVRTYDNGTDPAFDLEFDLYVATWTEHTTVGELIVEDLAEMGIKANIQPTNVTTLVSMVYRQKSDATMGDWDLHVWGRPWAPEFDYAGDQWQQYESSNPLRLSKRGYIMGWTGAEAEAYDDVVAALKAREEGNATRNAEILEAMQMWADDLPAIPLYNSINPGVHRTDMYSGWIEDNGMLAFGAVTAMTAIYNIMNLEPI
ncbi:hypothetical protein ACFLVP_04635, partial [Chloroflexota bacterium]